MHELARLLRYCRPYAGRLVAAAVAMVGVSLFTLRIAALIRPLFDDVLVDPTAGRAVWWFPLQLVLFYAAKGLCAYGATTLMASVGQGVVHDLRCDLYTHLQLRPVGFFDRTTSGETLARLTSDVERVQGALADKLTTLARESLVLVALAGWLVYLDWRLAAVSLLLAPAAVLPLVRFGHRLRGSSHRYQEALGEMVTQVGDAVRANRIVKVFAAQEFETGRFRDLSRRLRRASLRGARAAALSSPLMELLGGVAAALIFVYGHAQIDAGAMTVGEFTSFLAALFLMYTPMKKLNAAHATLQQAAASAERIERWRQGPVESLDGRGSEIGPLREAIEFRRVDFAYGERPALRGVSFRVRAGSVVAIVGPSGAGKSTLVSLLPRFHDVASGAVLIDGRDVRGVRLAALRRQIGMVTQDTVLFHDTVRNNIAYAAPERPFDEIEAAARAAHADEFIAALPLGYDTVVGEGGINLSGGQRQRIAIARALLKNPPILILDEATSALDVESEQLVQAALERLVEGRTVLIVAHRLSTVRRADEVVVLDRGELVERGTPEALSRRDGAFARLVRLSAL